MLLSTTSAPLSIDRYFAATSDVKMSAAAEKVKDVAVEEVKRIEQLTNDAARSGAYLYPIRVCPHALVYA